jgi:2-methylisocitrate lyase-like PEP mutase family enzyme
VLGLDEAIQRGQDSMLAGADVIFIEAPETIDEIKQIANTIRATLLLNMVTKGGKTPFVPTDELERMGYDIILFASDVQRAAIFAMRRLLYELYNKGTSEHFGEVVSFQEREQIVNTPYYQDLQKRFLSLN